MTTTTHNFSGRTALITGAASGIGAACARWLDARGVARLLMVDPNREGLEALELRCDTVHFANDVSDPDFWTHFEREVGSIDHAVVNAGIGEGGSIAELSLESWRKVMAVNLDGAFLTLASGMRLMADKGGSAVVVASSAGVKPLPGVGAYGVSKAAVAHMARIAAIEGSDSSIRVNAIAPGGVDTAIWDSSPEFRQAVEEHGREAALQGLATGTPRGRLASADEIAGSIGYLLSDAAANVTGTVLVSDGGFTL